MTQKEKLLITGLVPLTADFFWDTLPARPWGIHSALVLKAEKVGIVRWKKDEKKLWRFDCNELDSNIVATYDNFGIVHNNRLRVIFKDVIVFGMFGSGLSSYIDVEKNFAMIIENGNGFEGETLCLQTWSTLDNLPETTAFHCTSKEFVEYLRSEYM